MAFPYKDCVLEGGQTKEDVKRNEVFWNETLAPDEIDKLLEPKVFTNFKKYDAKGEHSVQKKSKRGAEMVKMATGGFVRAADGCATKGKTKAKQITMRHGGKC